MRKCPCCNSENIGIVTLLKIIGLNENDQLVEKSLHENWDSRIMICDNCEYMQLVCNLTFGEVKLIMGDF